MKKGLLLLIILLVTVACQKEQSKVYFQNENGEFLTQKELNETKAAVIEKFSEKYPNATVSETIMSETERNDSIIKVFKINVDLGKIDSAGEVSNTQIPALKVAIGDNIPATTLTMLDDTTFDTQNLSGKPTLYNFWFTTCKPCIDEMPGLDELREKYKDQMNFISITFNTKQQVEKFMEKHEFAFAKAVNAQEFIDQLGISSFPRNLFVKKDGTISAIAYGIPQKYGEEGVLEGESMETFEEFIKNIL